MHPRQERQIRGRTARQGDPGRIEFYLSLEDPLFRRWWPPGALRLLSMAGGELPRWLGACLLKLPQHRQERRHRADRAQLLRREEQLEELLAVGGPLE
jgi:preprotein translocase subunit SecA